MSEIAQYILGVILIPAIVAAVIALPFVVRPLRDRRALAEAAVACAPMAAFVASFTAELGWTPILRQFITIEGDDAPFERWHRLATIALGLGAAVSARARWWASARRWPWPARSLCLRGFPVNPPRCGLCSLASPSWACSGSSRTRAA